MKVGIFGSQYQQEKQSIIRRVFSKLTSLEAEIYVDTLFHDYLLDAFGFEPPINGLLTGDIFDLDVAISLGGDGTFLRTAARVNRQNIPILGINTGRLGFLADVGSTDVEDTLEELFKHYYKVEERILLRLETESRAYKGYNYALNEVAVLKRDTSSMITIHTSLNGEYLTSYQADGLVIATPTGSTAYSMSVNGPIILPQDNSIVLSPVAPHSLNVRPLVIPNDFEITLGVESRNRTFLISLDGRSEIFPAGIQLKVSKADYTTKVIKRYNHTFYETLREKLMWGADVRMK
ncbi:probable inorganic polyphosphate/ATP-NAD kinase [Parabacteroides sp. CAG:409]|uniref:NAD kinase n=1 Tax=Parabacteroides faecalis TaxID=2924040 RepID=A0ABT0BZL4_9BACT|nr:NAD kinase [Parabacteroides faecalis]MBS7343006.1 NAD kinase [Parabacteroides sp.]CDE61435.1 probable inorganic polyphosphate/ATP-NAD kinase [Parabacteroides sp. CAG:409]HIX21232.1 NAD kinase [Candidatus Parabacteroides faecavium]MCI7286185.1 NAD kinase [Parabacteroides sp.]MCI7358149.1 NAD kinase [Parabacteroides sp.]